MEKQLKMIPLFDTRFGIKLGAEQSDYSSVSYQHGYGQLSKAGAVVGKGVKGRVTIDLEIDTYDLSAYTATTQEVKDSVTSHTHEHLEETEKTRNYSDWWFWMFSSSGKDYNHYKDSTSDSVNITDHAVTDSLTKNFSESKKTYKVSGVFEIEGKSDIPTQVYLYIETLNITTSDGTTTTVINSTPVAADASGNTGSASTSGTLNIIPLGK